MNTKEREAVTGLVSAAEESRVALCVIAPLVPPESSIVTDTLRSLDSALAAVRAAAEPVEPQDGLWYTSRDCEGTWLVYRCDRVSEWDSYAEEMFLEAQRDGRIVILETKGGG